MFILEKSRSHIFHPFLFLAKCVLQYFLSFDVAKEFSREGLEIIVKQAHGAPVSFGIFGIYWPV